MQATTNIEKEFSKLKFSQNTKHPRSKVFGVFFLMLIKYIGCFALSVMLTHATSPKVRGICTRITFESTGASHPPYDVAG